MKFIDELRSGRAQLFDVREDPDERRNVAGAHAEQVGEYERHAAELERGAKADDTRRVRGTLNVY